VGSAIEKAAILIDEKIEYYPIAGTLSLCLKACSVTRLSGAKSSEKDC
jgi:hypothetical protein